MLGHGGAVAFDTEIITDPFDTFQKVFAFLGVEGQSELDEDSADALKVTEECVGVVREDK